MKRQLFSLAKTMKVQVSHNRTSRTTSSVERPSVNFVVRSLRHFSGKKKKKKHIDCLQPPLSKMVYAGPGVNLIKLLHV